MIAKDCPFCGKSIDPDDIDTLYPSGSGWKESDWGDGTMIRHYVSVHSEKLPKEQWCYKIICQTHYGGCGATMYGDSKEETLENWNKRVE